MAYVICEPCVGVKDGSCVDVCPIPECISEANDQWFIDPEMCLDCGACAVACPVGAPFLSEDVPPEWSGYIAKNEELAKRRNAGA